MGESAMKRLLKCNSGRALVVTLTLRDMQRRRFMPVVTAHGMATVASIQLVRGVEALTTKLYRLIHSQHVSYVLHTCYFGFP
jgi:hypothetical protein